MKLLYGKQHPNKGSSVPGGEKNRQATEVQEVQSVIFFLLLFFFIIALENKWVF